jgi:uncharacterized protein with FMN-binding domain
MNNKKIFISLAAVIVVAAGVVGIAAINKKPETPIDSPVATPVADMPATTSSSPAKTTAGEEYKDGTYTATGTYKSPGGIDNLGVSVTLKNDIATAVTVTPMPHDPESARYQSLFVSGYQPFVVGKKLDSINLSGSISGSSLTEIGFNDAIAQIKAQAKA